MRLSLLALVLFLSACTSTSTTTGGDRTLYQALGGAEGVDAIVYDLIVRIADDERVVHRFKNVDINRFKSGLETYICSVSDGPCDYTGDSMRVVHAGHQYTDTEFNTIVELLIEAMEAQGVATPTQNRLLARLAQDYEDVVYH
ncbi:group 1 truncated hemoglobin [Marinimicrobium sp. C6131]|uniref:group I truncated hemoglobin n=1 Tax=Marinimicrobium sp. C6131 TaxID=3022676 RepID=UPI00223D3E3F|nr:group 1 truncated hemoglobin [Marinimicrobium sp. C6131]UZJ43885.1 group 1 truncated hemoglobin [Marinimicrobium sp. C6131]